MMPTRTDGISSDGPVVADDVHAHDALDFKDGISFAGQIAADAATSLLLMFRVPAM